MRQNIRKRVASVQSFRKRVWIAYLAFELCSWRPSLIGKVDLHAGPCGLFAHVIKVKLGVFKLLNVRDIQEMKKLLLERRCCLQMGGGGWYVEDVVTLRMLVR